MAIYKQDCMHCHHLIDRDSRVCPFCGSRAPFGYFCPSCNKKIEKEQRNCPGCGRSLYITCPLCGQETFVQEQCEKCGEFLMVRCKNIRCQEWQFFQNEKCTACGKRIKKGR